MSRTATAGLHLMLLPALLTSLTGGLVAFERLPGVRPPGVVRRQAMGERSAA